MYRSLGAFLLCLAYFSANSAVAVMNRKMFPEGYYIKDDALLHLLEEETNCSTSANDSRHLHMTNDSSSYGMAENLTIAIYSNQSSLERQVLTHAPEFSLVTAVKVITLCCIASVAFAGNLATLLSIIRNFSKSRSTIYLLIAHLAFADLLVTIFCLVGEAVWTYTVQWLAGNAFCKIVKFFQMFSLYLSTFILVVIGFDRYMAVKFPMKKANARARVKKTMIVLWLASALLSSPQLVIFRVVKGPFIEEFYQCVTYGFYTADWQEQAYTTISLVLMFLLPLCILMFTYICTFYTIAKKEDGISDRPSSVMDEARRKLLRKAKMKALMITVVIVMAFVICWTPYYCMMIIFIFLDPDDQLSEELQAAIFFFGSSTAMINPIIYGAFHLRRTTPRTKAHNSSGSSKAENTVMLVTFRKARVNLQKIPDPNMLHPTYEDGKWNVRRELSYTHSFTPKYDSVVPRSQNSF